MNPFSKQMPLTFMNSKSVSVKQLASTLTEGRRPQIVDVRSVSEFATGHLPGAINIPMETVDSRVGDLDLTAPTVLVCQSGKRASMVCERTVHLFKDVAVLEGGTTAWQKEGGETIRSASTSWSLERQVRLAAGLLVLLGVGLSLLVNPGWIWLSAFVGAGLTFAGLTNLCLMASLLAKLPWNRSNGA